MTSLIHFLISILFGAYINQTVLPKTTLYVKDVPRTDAIVKSQKVPIVPFFSQFYDIHWEAWRKKACGVASLAMIIEFYRPGAVSAQTLLQNGIAAGAYLENAGWTHKGLIALAQNYGFEGKIYDLSGLDMKAAFERLIGALNHGPVIASVYYKMEPGNPIPHLAVINGIDGDIIYYNDPAGYSGGKQISVEHFKAAWKKRFIVIRPNANTLNVRTLN